MRRTIGMLVLLGLPIAASPALARDDVVTRPIAAALAAPQAHRQLRFAVAFHFGVEPGLAIAKKFESVEAHRRSILNAQDPASCDHVFVAALASLAADAKKAGADAVVNIVSVADDQQVMSSRTDYDCHRGAAVTVVMLRGDLVRLSAP